MRRIGLSVLCSIAIAAGCSSRSSFYGSDGGADGGSSITADGGSSSTDGGKRKDTGTTEEEDAAIKKDSSVSVDGCEPGSVSGFTPTWKAPNAPHANKCTATQVEALLCLFDANADQTTCQTVVDDPANDNCFKCIYTASSSAKLGPVVINGSLGSLNIAGCIAAAEGNTTSSGCGAKVQAADQCGGEACDANCPVPEGDDAALDARNACVEQAATTVCQTFTTDAECAEPLLASGGSAAVCASGTNFLDRAIAIAKFFCGP
jgi:hypothetical protein